MLTRCQIQTLDVRYGRKGTILCHSTLRTSLAITRYEPQKPELVQTNKGITLQLDVTIKLTAYADGVNLYV